MRALHLSLVLVAAAACRPIDVTPVTSVLDASVALGLAGSIAMTAIAGEGPGCATLTPECTAAPCAARVEVAVSEACPLAVGASSGGTVILDGSWADENTGTFTPDLTSMVGVEDGAVQLNLGAVVLTRDEDEVTVVFAEQGVEADEGGDADADVDQQGWLVTVHLGGTPADPSDDALDLSGAGQSAAASSGSEDSAAVRQLAIALTVTDPSCRRNPVSGSATVSDVGDANGEETSLLFHEECDGEADVVVSSADPTKIGSSIPLGYGSE